MILPKPLCFGWRQASQHGAAEPVVRVPWAEPVVVKRVLDLGAQSTDAQLVSQDDYDVMVPTCSHCVVI